MCSSRNKQNVKIVFFFWQGSQVCGISRTPNLFTPPHQQPFSHNKRATHRFCANLHGCLDLVYIQAKRLFPFYITQAFAEKNSTTRRFLSCHCPSSFFFLLLLLFGGSQRDTFWNRSGKLQAMKKVVLFHCGECVFTLDTNAECRWSLTALVI